MARKFQSITVGELRQILEDYDEDDMIAFSSDYGDHCHTEQLHSIKGAVDEVKADTTGYSDSGFKVVYDEDEKWEEDEDEKDESKKLQKLLLLK